MPLLLTVCLLLLALPAAAVAQSPCAGDPRVIRTLDIPVAGETAHGEFTLPAAAPRGLVVFAHGTTHTAQSWREHMQLTSRRDGVVAVAMDYRGLRYEGTGPEGRPRSRGWPTIKGAQDLVAAAKHFEGLCGDLPGITLVGTSMGANMAGIALASKPRRADGLRPLFDYWIGIESVQDLVETYSTASFAASFGNEFGQRVKEDIEAETGGTPDAVPDAFRLRSNISRVEDIAASGIRGAVFVHAIEDAVALHPAMLKMTDFLREQAVPVDVFSVGRNGAGDPGIVNPGAPQGSAGHGSEISQEHVVIVSGLDRLNALLTRGEPAPCDRTFRIDERPSNVAPSPRRSTALCRPDPLPAAGGPCTDSAPPAPGHLRVPAIRPLRLTGRAGDRGCGRIARVEVALARRAGSRCRWYGGRRFARAATSCGRPRWVRATGTESWRLRFRQLSRGTYQATVRATDAAGNRGPASRVVSFRSR